jgi:Fe-S-cluster containining protein
MNNALAIVAAVEEVYRHINAEISLWFKPASSPNSRLSVPRPEPVEGTADSCSACGKCCDFDAYDHRLFVTSPEMVYLIAKLGRANILPMAGGMCPYNLRGECTIHPYRFAGCRIFFCKGDAAKQAQLSEWASARFKDICQDSGLDYAYTDLKTALNDRQF